MRVGADRARSPRARAASAPLADLRGGRLGGDQLELRGEPRLTEGRDRLAPQPLDLLLRAAALGPRRSTSASPSWGQGYGISGLDACIQGVDGQAGRADRGPGRPAYAPAAAIEPGGGNLVKVPLTILDFLDRAELVYGARPLVVDEPDQPAAPLGPSSPGAASPSWPGPRPPGSTRSASARASGWRSSRRTRPACSTAFFGVSGYGRVLVPINFRLNADEVAYIVEHSGASVLLVDPELDEHARRRRRAKHRFVLGAETRRRALPVRAPSPSRGIADEDATATINYTSGTTARPKGVQLTHRNLWLNADHLRLAGRASATATSTCTRCRCSTATAGACPTPSPAWAARTSCCARSTAPRSCAASTQHGVTLLCGAPAVVDRVLDAAADVGRARSPGADRVRIVVAGAPPPTRTIERVETELGWEFIQIYGLTETSPLLTMNRRRAEWDDLSPAERAAQARPRRRARARRAPPRRRARARCWPRSNVVLEGYWEQPEATAEAIVDGWFHTGDGGTIDDEGYLTISDRKKDVIITGGENVSSIEVEDALFSHPAVAEVAVIGVPDEKWGETVKALVVLRARCRRRPRPS